MAKKKTYDHLFSDDETKSAEDTQPNWLDAAEVTARTLVVGDRFKGEVIAVNAQEAFLSSGTPVDAVMPFRVTDSQKAPQVGDSFDVIVVRTKPNELLVKPAGQLADGIEAENIEDAYKLEIPVDGQVLEVVKGGFRVKVQNLKAFCPISQMDWRVTDANEYIGKRFRFLITKFERGPDLVVSRRRILEGERAGSEQKFLSESQEGDLFIGKVTRLERYGAFIRLENGIEGLIPVGEIDWSRIHHPQEVLNLEQTVQVKLLKMDKEEGRLKLSFSLKQGGSIQDPWALVEVQFAPGTILTAQVERREPYGLFFKLANGVTGLMPKSAWRDSTESKKWESLKIGDGTSVQVQSVDVVARRISLQIPSEVNEQAWRDHLANSKGATPSFGTMAQAFASAGKKSAT